MKILFPDGDATDTETEEVLRYAIEGRKRVKDQLLRIDATYPAVHFAYITAESIEKSVQTLEELEYPNYYHRTVSGDAGMPSPEAADTDTTPANHRPQQSHR